MPKRPPTFRPFGAAPARQQSDRQRGSACKRGYGRKWQKARERYLSQNPLCVECIKQDVSTEATVVDHVIPHRGNDELFWDEGNWQALCKAHHDRKTGGGG